MSQLPRRLWQRVTWRSAARIQAEVDEELRFEIDMRTAELVKEGLPDANARAKAVAEFGDMEHTRRYCAELDREGEREERRTEWLAELRQDVVLAWRGMRRTPGFALVVLAMLALGIGCNTAVFSVVRKVLLDQLPYRDADHLMRLYGGTAGRPDARGMLTAADIEGLQQSRAFSGVAPFGNSAGYTFVSERGADIWQGMSVGAGFFRLLGSHALLGRAIDERDTGPDAIPAVLLSYDLWQRSFAGDSGIVGRGVQLNGHRRTVIGVMPREFVSPTFNAESWTPLDMRPFTRDPAAARRNHMWRAIGRQADGVSQVQLRAELDAISHRAREQYPELREDGATVAVPLRDAMIGDVRPVLLVVMGAAALVLVIACVNVAGLFLSRGRARRREFAVRAALGARRGRLVRQLLTESAMIGLAGGAIGVALAFGLKRILVAAAGRMLSSVGDVRIDAGVLAFAVAVSLLSGLAFGLVPAMVGTRFNLGNSLAESGRGASGGRTSARMGRALVIGQVALAVVMLIGAGLLGRTLITLERGGVGYDVSRSVLTTRVNLSSAKYADSASRAAFFDALTERIRAIPGVRGVGMTDVSPWNGPGARPLAIDGRAESDNWREDGAVYSDASEDYFVVLGIPVRRGRSFTATDRAGAPLVALVSESLVRRYWPGGSPIGSRIRIGERSAPWREVVGVVGDVRASASADAEPTVYVPMRQDRGGGAEFVVRGDEDASALVPAIRRELRAMDPALPLIRPRTMQDVFETSLAGHRLPVMFTTAFASLALLLAALGVYSVLAYSVSARAREFGIRAALGARRGSVLALVLRQGMTMALAGTAIGVIVAATATRSIAALLVGVAPHDPATFVAMPLILLVVTCLACLIPARRATKMEPLDALRAE
ncbi:MAG: ABC transporter permease [Gemmatimonadota bacterium]|nr:ABC transporter permease [Gemmatimonadota bacterium]